MSAAPHDRDPRVPQPRRANAESAERGRAADPARDTPACIGAGRWLVDELRDECSDIGISARGFDLDAFLAGVAVFATEARRLGAPPERMLVLLKACLADDSIPARDREEYRIYLDRAVSTAVRAYFGAEDGPPAEAAGAQTAG